MSCRRRHLTVAIAAISGWSLFFHPNLNAQTKTTSSSRYRGSIIDVQPVKAKQEKLGRITITVAVENTGESGTLILRATWDRLGIGAGRVADLWGIKNYVRSGETKAFLYAIPVEGVGTMKVDWKLYYDRISFGPWGDQLLDTRTVEITVEPFDVTAGLAIKIELDGEIFSIKNGVIYDEKNLPVTDGGIKSKVEEAHEIYKGILLTKQINKDILLFLARFGYHFQPLKSAYAWIFLKPDALLADLVGSGPAGIAKSLAKDAIITAAKVIIEHPEETAVSLAMEKYSEGLQAFEENLRFADQFKQDQVLSYEQAMRFKENNRKSEYMAVANSLTTNIVTKQYDQAAAIKAVEDISKTFPKELSVVNRIALLREIYIILDETTKGLELYPPYQQYVSKLEQLEKKLMAETRETLPPELQPIILTNLQICGQSLESNPTIYPHQLISEQFFISGEASVAPDKQFSHVTMSIVPEGKLTEQKTANESSFNIRYPPSPGISSYIISFRAYTKDGKTYDSKQYQVTYAGAKEAPKPPITPLPPTPPAPRVITGQDLPYEWPALGSRQGWISLFDGKQNPDGTWNFTAQDNNYTPDGEKPLNAVIGYFQNIRFPLQFYADGALFDTLTATNATKAYPKGTKVITIALQKKEAPKAAGIEFLDIAIAKHSIEDIPDALSLTMNDLRDGRVEIRGEVDDNQEGASIKAVEVDLGDGRGWQQATGRLNWRFEFVPRPEYDYRVSFRAADLSGKAHPAIWDPIKLIYREISAEREVRQMIFDAETAYEQGDVDKFMSYFAYDWKGENDGSLEDWNSFYVNFDEEFRRYSPQDVQLSGITIQMAGDKATVQLNSVQNRTDTLIADAIRFERGQSIWWLERREGRWLFVRQQSKSLEDRGAFTGLTITTSTLNTGESIDFSTGTIYPTNNANADVYYDGASLSLVQSVSSTEVSHAQPSSRTFANTRTVPDDVIMQDKFVTSRTMSPLNRVYFVRAQEDKHFAKITPTAASAGSLTIQWVYK